MKKFRLSIALLLLALVFAVVPAALAQGDTLGASQADFNLWTSANSGSFEVNTVSLDGTVSLKVTGMGSATDDVTADLKFTGAVDVKAQALQLDVTGSAVQGTDTTPINLGVRVVDGNVYYNDGSGWKGDTLSDVSSSLSGLASSSGMPVNPSDLSSGNLSDLAGMSGMGDALSALSNLNPSNFLSLARADEGGQAHFTLNLDIAKLLSDPALAPLLTDALSMSSGLASDTSGSTPAPTQDPAQAQQMIAMIGMMFSTSTVAFDEWIDPSSQMINRAALDINLPLDNMLGPGAGFAFNFDVSMSNYNQPVTVDVPEGVQMKDASAG